MKQLRKATPKRSHQNRTIGIGRGLALFSVAILTQAGHGVANAQQRPTPNNTYLVTDPVSGNSYKIETYGGRAACVNSANCNYAASFQNAYTLSNGWITSPSNAIWNGDQSSSAKNDIAYEAARGWANQLPITGDKIGFATFGKPSDKDVYAFFGAQGYGPAGANTMNPVWGLYTPKSFANPLPDLGWAFVERSLIPITPTGNLGLGNGINKTSNLDSLISPIFQGGTLTVDQDSQTFSQSFTLPQDGTIDTNNNDATFSGTFTGQGTLSFTNGIIQGTGQATKNKIFLGSSTNPITAGGLRVIGSALKQPVQATLLGATTVSGDTIVNYGDLNAKNAFSTNNLLIEAIYTDKIASNRAFFNFLPTGPSQRLTIANDLDIKTGELVIGQSLTTPLASLEANMKAGRIYTGVDSTIRLTAPAVIEVDRDSLITGALEGTTGNIPCNIKAFDDCGKFYKPITLQGAGEITFANTSSALLRSQTTAERTALSPDLQIEGKVKINSNDFKLKRFDNSNLDVANGNLFITSTGQVSGVGVITANVWNEGNVSPGDNGIGTLNVDGNYLQGTTNPSAILNIDVNGSESDLLKITGSSRVVILGGNLNISSYQSAPVSSNLIYTAIDVTGSNPQGGELSLKTNLNVVGSSGLKFVRETDPDFATLSPAASDYYKICTSSDPNVQQGCTKLQFAWLKVNPQTSTAILPTTVSTPGVQTIQSVKQTGGAITTASSGNVAANNATCTSNGGSASTCQQQNKPGTGAGASNKNTVATAKTLDAGWASVSAAVTSGVTGGEAIGTTGYTTNQTSAALVTPDFANVIAALFAVPTRQQLNQALHSISAEPYASMQSVALEAMEQFRANTLALTSGNKAIPFIAEEEVCTLDDNVKPGSDGNPQPQPDCKPRTIKKLTPWSLLIDGTNTQATLNGTNDLASLDYNIFSSSYGLQYDFNRNWSAGAAFGYGRANLYNYEYADVRIDSSTYSGAAWGIYRPSESWKFTALAGYMNLQYESDRNINFGGLNRTANANWSGNGFTAALAAEYDWVLSSDKTSRSAVRIKPNTFFSYALHNQGAFSETGADSLNLALNSHTADSLIYGIGFQIETPIITGKTSRLIPRLSLGYEYDFNGDSNEEHQLSASFADVPALGSVDVLGQNRGANALAVDLSLEYETSQTLSLYAGVGGAFWSNGNELSYGGGLKLRW